MSYECVINLCSADIHSRELENYLATDDLFVEYFNDFLKLPVFPEPLIFNKDTGGFEVYTDAPAKIQKDVQLVLLSKKKSSPIHSFYLKRLNDKVALSPVNGAVCKIVDTEYPVQTLEKISAMQWVKASRFPSFLKSDSYYEFKLAKILSQFSISGLEGEPIIISFTDQPTLDPAPSIREENVSSKQDTEMQEMYVSAGSTPTTDIDVWYSFVNHEYDTSVVSAVQTSVISKEQKYSIKSVYSSGWEAVSDVQITDQKNSASVTSDVSETTSNLNDNTKPVCGPCRPNACTFDIRYENRPPVYLASAQYDQVLAVAKQPSFAGDSAKAPDISVSISNIPSPNVQQPMSSYTLDEMSALIVASILRVAIADVYKIPVMDLPNIAMIDDFMKNWVTSDLLINKVNMTTQVIPEIFHDQRRIQNEKFLEKLAGLAGTDTGKISPGPLKVEENEVKIKVSFSRGKPTHSKNVRKSSKEWKNEAIKNKGNSKSSQTSSMKSFNEDRYPSIPNSSIHTLQANRVRHIRDKNKFEEFKKFISKTPGQQYWNFWLDVEKSSFIVQEFSNSEYINWMYRRYQLPGAKFELPNEIKRNLGLSPTMWTVEMLQRSQKKAAAALISYWLTKYLLQRHKVIKDDESFTSLTESSTHVLPQRPKSCVPRLESLRHLLPFSYTGRWNKVNSFENVYEQTLLQDPLPEAVMQLYHPYGDHKMWLQQLQYRTLQTGHLRPADTLKGLSIENLLEPPKAVTTYIEERKNWLITPRMVVEKLKTMQRNGYSTNLHLRQSPYTLAGVGKLKNEPAVRDSDALESQNSIRKQSVRHGKEERDSHAESHMSSDGKKKSFESLNESLRRIEKLVYSSDSQPPARQVQSTGDKSSVSTKTSLEGPRVKPITPSSSKSQDKAGLNSRHSLSSVQGYHQSLIRTNQDVINEKRRHTFDEKISITSKKSLDSFLNEKSKQVSDSAALNKKLKEPIKKVISEFYGGQRMESFLQALHYENQSGRFFGLFIQKSNNKVWSNCLKFWHSVQEYRGLFYEDTFEAYTVLRKAKEIYGEYLIENSSFDILFPMDMISKLYSRLIPPYEDLFDDIEENILNVLFEAWIVMLQQDITDYSRISQKEVLRNYPIPPKQLVILRRYGLVKAFEEKKVYKIPVPPTIIDSTLWSRVPDFLKHFTFDMLINNRIELEFFHEFLAKRKAAIDLECWTDVEAFRRLPPKEFHLREKRAHNIRIKYLNKNYFFGANSPADVDSQNAITAAVGGWGKILDDRPPNDLIIAAQKYVRARIENQWLPMFLASEAFIERHSSYKNEENVLEDYMTYKHRATQRQLKLQESKWMSSSRDILMFRKSLLNPTTSFLFKKFLSLKGTHLQNNVQFWIEVQKYKNIHQSGCTDSILRQKIDAIINCYVDSEIPPVIQIDISRDQAKYIVDHKHEKGPYLFRDAQIAVFRALLPHWSDFCEFRCNIADEKILPMIERRQKQEQLIEQNRLEALKEEERIRQEYDRDDKLPESLTEVESKSWSYSLYMDSLKKEQIINAAEAASQHSGLELMAESSQTEGTKSKEIEEEND